MILDKDNLIVFLGGMLFMGGVLLGDLVVINVCIDVVIQNGGKIFLDCVLVVVVGQVVLVVVYICVIIIEDGGLVICGLGNVVDDLFFFVIGLVFYWGVILCIFGLNMFLCSGIIFLVVIGGVVDWLVVMVQGLFVVLVSVIVEGDFVFVIFIVVNIGFVQLMIGGILVVFFVLNVDG